MRKISNNSRSNTGSSGEGKSPNFGDNPEIIARIRDANKKVKLLNILKHYKIRVERNPQRPKWSQNIICPFPSHKGGKERTPSFAYNFETDHFSCLGCGQAGQAVEFLSLYTETSRSLIVDQITLQVGDKVPEEDYIEYKDEISPILMEASDVIRKALQYNKDNPKKLKKIQKLIIWIDRFISTKISGAYTDCVNLRHRVDTLKDLI